MEIRIEGFKSVTSLGLSLDSTAVLVGPPAGGKLNILDVPAVSDYPARFLHPEVYDGEVEPLEQLARLQDVEECNGVADINEYFVALKRSP